MFSQETKEEALKNPIIKDLIFQVKGPFPTIITLSHYRIITSPIFLLRIPFLFIFTLHTFLKFPFFLLKLF
jgi:hypothetical protein